jgi:hypothetical protein
MKAYGLPRNKDVEYPDVADIRKYGLQTSIGGRDYFKNKIHKAQIRRKWKKKERRKIKLFLKKEMTRSIIKNKSVHYCSSTIKEDIMNKKGPSIIPNDLRANGYSVAHRIRNGYYEPKIDFPQSPVKPYLAMDHSSENVLAYADRLKQYELDESDYHENLKIVRAARRKMEGKFKYDALPECGILGHPKSIVAFEMAQERGRSGGLNSVLCELEELAELLL